MRHNVANNLYCEKTEACNKSLHWYRNFKSLHKKRVLKIEKMDLTKIKKTLWHVSVYLVGQRDVVM